ITTHLVPADNERWVDRMWLRAREEIDAGGHVYVVCPRIDAENDEEHVLVPNQETTGNSQNESELVSVAGTVKELQQHPAFADMNIGMLHGR
ncbi:hypothetical protein MMA21_24335, partial [Salmonella enterica]|nr:hypothetical protein [Salmonella enterica]